MAKEQQTPGQHRKNNPQSDGVAQQPGLTGAESSGTSGLGGKDSPNSPNASSGAMDGQGTFGSGSNGPGMNQSSEAKGKANLKTQTEKIDKLKKGLDNNPTGPGDPETAQKGLI